MSDQEAQQIVLDAAHRLAEHFDCVQILATRMNQGHTQFVKKGVGNWYARHGMAQQFIQIGAAEDLATEIAEKLKPE